MLNHPRPRQTELVARVMIGWCVIAILLWSEAAGAAPIFPWASLVAIAEEHPVGSVDVCTPNDEATRLAALLIDRPPGFYRFWAMLHGPAWVAIHYDAEARPDWVWRGIWAGDSLRVASVSPYDPAAHASACDLFFSRR